MSGDLHTPSAWKVYVCDEGHLNGDLGDSGCNRCSSSTRPIIVAPITDESVERAAKALYEGPDQWGRTLGLDERGNPTTWEYMLTYGGMFPENRDHPFAEEYRRMARTVLEAARG